jgi:hypothetical protein
MRADVIMTLQWFACDRKIWRRWASPKRRYDQVALGRSAPKNLRFAGSFRFEGKAGDLPNNFRARSTVVEHPAATDNFRLPDWIVGSKFDLHSGSILGAAARIELRPLNDIAGIGLP